MQPMQRRYRSEELYPQLREAVRLAPRELSLQIDYAASDNLTDMCLSTFGAHMSMQEMVRMVKHHVQRCICPDSWIDNVEELAITIVEMMEYVKKPIKPVKH